MKITLSIIVLILMNSCNLDIVENNYKDYTNAIDQGFNGNGYIPIEFMKKSISDLRTISNMDSQEYLCKFRIIDSDDWNNIIKELDKCECTFSEPSTFEVPKWWDLEIEKTQVLCFTDEYGRTFPIAIDQNSKTIFSWYTFNEK